MENVAVAVKESCVLDVNSGTLLIISSGRVLTSIFNCSSKARYLSCNVKYRLAFSSSRRAFQESHLFSIPRPITLAKMEEAGQAKDFAALDILEALKEYLLGTLLG